MARRKNGLDLRLFAIGDSASLRGPVTRRDVAREGAARVARPRRLVDEEAEEQEGGCAGGAPEEAAQARADRRRGTGAARTFRAAGRRALRFRRRSALVEGEQDPRGLQLEGVAFARELLWRAFAGRVLQLSKLAEKRVALACKVAHLQGDARARSRHPARTGEHTPQEPGAQHARGEHGEGRDPVYALVVHDGEEGSGGGKPSGQP